MDVALQVCVKLRFPTFQDLNHHREAGLHRQLRWPLYGQEGCSLQQADRDSDGAQTVVHRCSTNFHTGPCCHRFDELDNLGANFSTTHNIAFRSPTDRYRGRAVACRTTNPLCIERSGLQEFQPRRVGEPWINDQCVVKYSTHLAA